MDDLRNTPPPNCVAASRPILHEILEQRLLMHGSDDETVYPFGTMVPWLTAAITPADGGGTSPPPPVVPPPPPPPNSPVGLAGLTLINAGTDTDSGPLAPGTVLDLTTGVFS